MGHAIAVSEQIDFLGGVPAVDVEKIETSSDSTEMLEQDLAGEFHAISRYKERIAEAEALQEYGLFPGGFGQRHGQAVVHIGDFLSGLVGRGCSRYQDTSLKGHCLGDVKGRPQVPVVNRIECAAEKTDAHSERMNVERSTSNAQRRMKKQFFVSFTGGALPKGCVLPLAPRALVLPFLIRRSTLNVCR